MSVDPDDSYERGLWGNYPSSLHRWGSNAWHGAIVREGTEQLDKQWKKIWEPPVRAVGPPPRTVAGTAPPQPSISFPAPLQHSLPQPEVFTAEEFFDEEPCARFDAEMGRSSTWNWGPFRPQWWIDHWPLSEFETMGENVREGDLKIRLLGALIGALALAGGTSGQSALWPWGHAVLSDLAAGYAPLVALGCGAIAGSILPGPMGNAMLLWVRIVAYVIVLGMVAAIAAGLVYGIVLLGHG